MVSDDREQRGQPGQHSNGGSKHRYKYRKRVKVRVRSKKKSPQSKQSLMPAVVALSAVAVLFVVVFTVVRTTQSDDSAGNSPASLENGLPELPPNRWVKIGFTYTTTWNRQRYSGAAYDTHREKYFVFGSDTHGENWDNSVHEFDPLILRWSDHYEPDRRRSYRVDEKGRPIAGDNEIRPWAMHTHDNLVYDPQLDALVVMAAPLHNPATRAVRGIKQHPTWIYDLKKREWRPLDAPEGATPFGFGGASAYDSDRDIILSYSQEGIWELGPEREHWLQASDEFHHEMHHSMVYDPLHKNFLVLGGQEEDCSVWVFTPGPEVGGKGVWEVREPGGDACTGDKHVPLAFDLHNGVALAVFDNPPPEDSERVGTSSTYVYDPEENVYQKLPKADLPAIGMNYTLVYDPTNRVFYLLQGGREDPPSVWALHLELLDFDS